MSGGNGVAGERLELVHVASEMAPVVKVGGLGDVVGALSVEQARRGHGVTVVLPAYQAADLRSLGERSRVASFELPWGVTHEPAVVDLYDVPGDREGRLRVLLIGHTGERGFFRRPGIYDDPASGEGYADNGERFLFFARAAVEALKHLDMSFDVLHAHDHQAGWVPCLVRTHESGHPALARAANIFTIHNLGYQGIHDVWVLGLAGFGRELFYPQSPFEFWNRVNYMKVGITFADMITTVSPRYAVEIQSSGEFGFGLEGVLARRSADLRGILNGIDDHYWDPLRDRHIPHAYDREHPAGKWKNRFALAQECGFPTQSDWPLVGMVSRLVDQKGFDLLEQAQADLMRLEARFVILGTGQARYQEACARMMAREPLRVHYRPGYDERFAHLIEAGSDLFLMPSRYEPCGLNQMYSLRYGTVPVVRATGGLFDTVHEFDEKSGRGTGFTFTEYTPVALLGALGRALELFENRPAWRRIQRTGMREDLSWDASAREYVKVYERAVAANRAGAA